MVGAAVFQAGFAQLGAGSENAARFRQRRHAQPLRRAPHGTRAVTRELRMALVTQDGGCKASKARAHVIYPFLPWVPNSTTYICLPKGAQSGSRIAAFFRTPWHPSLGRASAEGFQRTGHGWPCRRFRRRSRSRFQVSHGHRCLVAGSRCLAICKAGPLKWERASFGSTWWLALVDRGLFSSTWTVHPCNPVGIGSSFICIYKHIHRQTHLFATASAI